MSEPIEYNWAEQRILESGKRAKEIREEAEKNATRSDAGNLAVSGSKKTLQIHLMLDHVSKSGMYRVFRMFIVENDNMLEIRSLPQFEKKNIKFNRKKNGWPISGCGMDMGFALVYDIASFYNGDGYSLAYTHI